MKHVPVLRARTVDRELAVRLRAQGIHPVLSRILSSRGARTPDELDTALSRLATPETLAGAARAAEFLAQAIAAGERICVIADYDCDGATACAVAVRGLRRFGARVDYLVPNRFTHGYGLSPDIVELARQHPRLGRADWLLTVDNGIASLAGVAAANAAGMRVIVTDHHLPGPQLPAAEAIVNPNQPGCAFPNKHLAGVGVVFYLLGVLRSQLHARHGHSPGELVDLLDLVALGTIADVVRLDPDNRRLVAAGLRRIRAGRACPGLSALLQCAGVGAARASVRDLAFGLAPRINASGRLAEISTGIECLLADDADTAQRLAGELDAINNTRKQIERNMRAQALEELADLPVDAPALVVYREEWHEGVIGLIAGRLKERYWRPVLALAPARGEPGMLRGSGRSIPGVHLRDALASVASIRPDLVQRFGGHAMAAGLSLAKGQLAEFTTLLQQAVATMSTPETFAEVLLHDGALAPEEIDLDLVDAIAAGVWGQGFAPPLFVNEFEIARQRVVGSKHLKLGLRLGEHSFEAIAFGRTGALGSPARLVYRVERNEWRGQGSLQLLVEEVDTADASI